MYKLLNHYKTVFSKFFFPFYFQINILLCRLYLLPLYKGDVYFGGNPWVLTTAALASLLYRGAKHILTDGMPSESALDKWAEAFNVPDNGYSFPSSQAELAQVFAAQGDGVLQRIRYHVEGNG